MTEDIAALGLVELAGLIRRRKLSSVEATRACLDRIEAWQAATNSFIAVEAESALRTARRLDALLSKQGPVGPLHGVPLAHKDLFYRKGKICSAGSEIRRHWVAPYSATVMERLEAAGALSLGRLNMAEFAADAAGYNKHYGSCRNPWNPAHIAGGSSSGSAAAVAARLAFGALGSDTGGSIILPASACGVVGVKPTYGRVSRHGAVPRAWSLDHIGPIARTAADCAAILQVIAGHDPRDGTSSRERVPRYGAAIGKPIGRPRIGIPEAFFYDTVTGDVGKALRESLDVFKSLGAKIVPVPVPDPVTLTRLCDIIVRSEAAAIHGRWLRERPGEYSDYFRSRAETGLAVPAAWYLEALSLRGRTLAAFLDGTMSKVDVLHCPAIPYPTPSLRDLDHASTDPQAQAKIGGLANLTRLFNYLGTPSIAVPCGVADNGLPVSFQLVGRPFGEDVLLRLAHAFQTATDWHRRIPRLEEEGGGLTPPPPPLSGGEPVSGRRRPVRPRSGRTRSTGAPAP